MPSTEDSVFSPGFLIRLQYATYLFVGLLLTMISKGFLSSALSNIGVLRKGCELAKDSDALRHFCAGEMTAYRVSFSLTVFFFIHFLTVSDLTCCIRSSSRAEFQNSFFYLKSIFLGLLFFLTFFIPNSFFSLYAYVCLFASAFFLLLNVIFLVDFSYQWSDDWGRRSERHGKWMWYLLIIAVGSYLIGGLISIFSFHYFVPFSDCNYHAFSITSVLIGSLICTMVSCWVPHGSIVPSSIVFLYSSSVMFITLRASSDTRCNLLPSYNTQSTSANPQDNQSNSLWYMLLASLVNSTTLMYAVVSSGGNGSALNVGMNDDGEEEDPDESGHLSHYLFFYFVMIMGSMYLAMLATGWKISGVNDETQKDAMSIAFWVRSVTVWTSIVLYLWSLLAPYYCCRDRDYGFAIDDEW